MPKTIYEQEEYDLVNEELQGIMQTINRISNNIGSYYKDDKAHNYNEKGTIQYTGNYPLITLYENDLFRQLRFVKKYFKDKKDYTTRKFLDAGCGIGNVMILASAKGFDVYGIELSKKYYDVANVLWNIASTKLEKKKKVFNENILKFKNYKEYDIVYYYSPIANKELEQKFERKVEDECKVGAILICNRKQDERIKTDDRFQRLSSDGYHNIFIKVKE